MKRVFLTFLALGICGLGTLLADDNVRAVQTRLKQGGFYFGELNGQYNSETAAAVSRYQIRNGLPISGQLDAETAKALGVAAGTTVPANPEAADTWRRLRKTDQQFLQKLKNGKIPPPSPKAKTAPAYDTNQAGAVPAPQTSAERAPDVSTFVLSRERLRDYVAAFVLAGLDPHVGAELDFFADRVNYFDSGVVDRERIRKDLQRYDAQWPQRRFYLAGQVNVEPQPDSRVRVAFPLRFQLQNGARHSSGKVQKTLLLEVTGDDLQIVAVNERKAR